MVELSDCIFCKIGSGEIPAKKVLENEHAVAFWDISPRQPVHVLVIPKVHYENIAELVAADENLAVQVLKLGNEVAANLTDGSFRFTFNTGVGAGQTVFHAHGHITAKGERG